MIVVASDDAPYRLLVHAFDGARQAGAKTLGMNTDVLQPAMTAITLGCLALLRDAGHEPDCVAGHSLGELAALCAAGVLTEEETLYLATVRGRLMHEAAWRVSSG